MTIRCLAASVQSGDLDRHVDLAQGGLGCQRAPEGIEIGAGHQHLVGVHRVRREADDPFDIAAAARDVARHALEGGRVDLRRQQRDQVAVAELCLRPRHLRFDERLDRRLHAGVAQPPGQRGAGRLHLPRRQVHLHAEQQPAAHPDLLHVVHLDALLGQRGEQPRRDARTVLATHRHQERRR